MIFWSFCVFYNKHIIFILRKTNSKINQRKVPMRNCISHVSDFHEQLQPERPQPAFRRRLLLSKIHVREVVALWAPGILPSESLHSPPWGPQSLQ